MLVSIFTDFFSKMEHQCSICLLEDECAGRIKKCQRCTFFYHQKCLELWYQESTRNDCPVCGREIFKPTLYLALCSNLKRLNVLYERVMVFMILYFFYLASGKTLFLLMNIFLETYFNEMFQQILKEDTLKLIYLFLTTPILEKVYDILILKRLIYHQVEVLERMEDINDFRNLFLACHRLCHKIVGFCLLYNIIVVFMISPRMFRIF